MKCIIVSYCAAKQKVRNFDHDLNVLIVVFCNILHQSDVNNIFIVFILILYDFSSLRCPLCWPFNYMCIKKKDNRSVVVGNCGKLERYG